eukprot:TRINITY_DN483_c0_g1_i4.p1 TRINITY_DN483_c0_g1~~TRINITY_DN483_c0_g1_i4.p1  ORF type:complete len:169 (-),score=5.94 TRINITY_DN483_c0_g1_i4:57-563(-)
MLVSTLPKLIEEENGTSVYLSKDMPDVVVRPADEELRGVSIGLRGNVIVYVSFSVDCILHIKSPSFRSFTDRSLVHIRFKGGYKPDFSLEVSELDDEIVFDFDKRNRFIGFVICVLHRVPSELQVILTPQVSFQPISLPWFCPFGIVVLRNIYSNYRPLIHELWVLIN